MSQESFKQVVSESQSLREQWELVTTRIQAEASELGVSLDRSQIAELSAARLATVSKDVDLLDGWQAEAEKLFPEIAAALHKKEVREQIEKGGDPLGVSEGPAPSFNEAARRMNEARRYGLVNTAAAADSKPAKMDPAAEALLIRRLLTLPPQIRMAEARKAGLL